ncbi:unnamed protein product, partial [Ectocarpus sp. 8 AP-2014]
GLALSCDGVCCHWLGFCRAFCFLRDWHAQQQEVGASLDPPPPMLVLFATVVFDAMRRSFEPSLLCYAVNWGSVSNLLSNVLLSWASCSASFFFVFLGRKAKVFVVLNRVERMST